MIFLEKYIKKVSGKFDTENFKFLSTLLILQVRKGKKKMWKILYLFAIGSFTYVMFLSVKKIY